VNLSENDFRIFDLPERFALDRADLDARWRKLQASAHPDKFAADGTAAQRVAMQWSVRINAAYRRLREPLSRAAYLCELRGAPIAADSNTAMPAEFLMQQMGWREALEDAEDADALAQLEEEVRSAERSMFGRVAQALDGDGGSAADAALEVRALMFVTRFRADVDRRLQTIES
jgi:molecular chaperone HscB